jgi:hypothetical protein
MVPPPRASDIKAVRIFAGTRNTLPPGPLPETTMSIAQNGILVTTQSKLRSLTDCAARVGRVVLVAGVVAATAVSIVPRTAQAGSGNGAAIGLGILGGVIAGAAIAATAPPVYAAPPYSYSYPPSGYYYNATPGYYYSPSPYYGSPAGYGYPYYNYR